MGRPRAPRTSATLLAGWLICASSPTLAATGEPEPASDGALPRYDEAIPIQGDPLERPALREVPSDGGGLLAAGGTLTVFGGATLVSGIVLATGGDALAEDWVPLILVAGIGTTVGSILLGLGATKHREYRGWKAQQPDAIPRQGLALVGSGTALMVLGVFGTVFSASVWTDETDPLAFSFNPHPGRVTAAKIGIGLGVTSFAVGTSLLASGAVRHKRLGVWRRTQTVRLAPFLVPARFGLQVGLAGRF